MTKPTSADTGRDPAFNSSGAAIKKLSVLLPAALHRRAKRHALLHDKTLTTLIIELLTQTLDEAEEQRTQP